jgi:hypothetical protein
MKTQQVVQTVSIKAAADLVPSRFAGFDGNYAGAGLNVLGVVGVATSATEWAPIHTYGIVLVEAGAAIAAAAEVEVGVTGKVITKAAGKVVGIAWDAATGAGEFIRVKLT